MGAFALAISTCLSGMVHTWSCYEGGSISISAHHAGGSLQRIEDASPQAVGRMRRRPDGTLILCLSMERSMPADSWGRMAEWYDAKQGDTGDFWHRTLIDPTFLRVVGDVRGLHVLDLGCG